MEERMSLRSFREFVEVHRRRYDRASRAGKGAILDEGCRLFGVHRKSLIRAFGRRPVRPRRRPGPPRRYGPEILKPLKVIWLAAQQPCGKRLGALVECWLPFYEKRHGTLSEEARRGLLAVSPATIDRMLSSLRARRRKGLGLTRSAPHLVGQIPIRTRFQAVDGPGFFEADTVAHCGQTTAGRFVWSLTLTDIWSGWTENAAIWNRSSRQIVERLAQIEERLAFAMLGFDSDNGSEFINHHLVRHLHERPEPIYFTRSRPYRKNDNAHVEQKQWTHVRQLLGYDRLEDRRLVEPIDDLYAHEWRALHNFFLPSMRLVSKERDGGHLRRHHSKPMTPCQRLLACPNLCEERKRALSKEFESLDPFELQDQIERKLKAIFRMARKTATTRAA